MENHKSYQFALNCQQLTAMCLQPFGIRQTEKHQQKNNQPKQL